MQQGRCTTACGIIYDGGTTMRDMPNLDFVRSVAVISVVLEHTLLALGIQQVGRSPVGYLGVMA